MSHFRLTLACMAAALACTSVQATTRSVGFTTRITVTQLQTNGICTSTSLGNQTGAEVRVVCATGEFVSIDARPGLGFGLAHGGASRFILIERVAMDPSFNRGTDQGVGTGTVTSARVLNNSPRGDDLEMLVSF